LIDDIYDVYRRLIEEGQMFEDIIDKRMDPVDAIFVSIKNIFALLSWREMEISPN